MVSRHGSIVSFESDPNKKQPEGLFTKGARVANIGKNITNTYDKMNETVLTQSGLPDYQFNYRTSDGQQLMTTNLFRRTAAKGNNIVSKYINSSWKSAYGRIEVNPEAVDYFEYGGKTGEEAVDLFLQEKGLSTSDIDAILKRTSEGASDGIEIGEKVGGDILSKGQQFFKEGVSRLKEGWKNLDNFTDEKTWRLLPDKDKYNLYKTRSFHKDIANINDKVNIFDDGFSNVEEYDELGEVLSSDDMVLYDKMQGATEIDGKFYSNTPNYTGQNAIYKDGEALYDIGSGGVEKYSSVENAFDKPLAMDPGASDVVGDLTTNADKIFAEDAVNESLNLLDHASDVIPEEELIQKGTEEIGKKVLNEAGEEIVEEIGKEVLEETAEQTLGQTVASVTPYVGTALGVKQMIEGVSEGEPMDVVHGGIKAATPLLMAAGPVGWGVIAVNTVWDILDG